MPDTQARWRNQPGGISAHDICDELWLHISERCSGTVRPAGQFLFAVQRSGSDRPRSMVPDQA
jgi:hypothetical protein